MSNIKPFILGAVAEIKEKVTWPPYRELQRSSVLVLIVSFLFAIVVGIMDLSFKKAITWFYNFF